MPAILIVDDNAPVLDLMEKVLSLENYEVCQASDGREALKRVRSQPFDLVITDIDMPVMNGIDLLRSIRAEGLALPVLAMSGDFDTEQAIQAGFDAFICKPFKISLVLDMVAGMLKPPRKVLIVDDLPEMRTVVRSTVERLGLRAAEAGNGREALDTLGVEPMDLVICDCAMPIMDGRDFLAEAQRLFPDLRVIVTSANFREEDARKLKPFGFLKKPYRVEDLKRVILDALGDDRS